MLKCSAGYLSIFIEIYMCVCVYLHIDIYALYITYILLTISYIIIVNIW